MDGYGYTPAQVGDMTLDQIFMLLCERKLLRAGRHRTVALDATEALGLTQDADGLIQGRTTDGKVFKARVGGKSLARQLMEEEAERKSAGKKIRKGPFDHIKRSAD